MTPLEQMRQDLHRYVPGGGEQFLDQFLAELEERIASAESALNLDGDRQLILEGLILDLRRMIGALPPARRPAE